MIIICRTRGGKEGKEISGHPVQSQIPFLTDQVRKQEEGKKRGVNEGGSVMSKRRGSVMRQEREGKIHLRKEEAKKETS